MLASHLGSEKEILRSKQCHICASNNRIRDSSMESRDCYEHDGICKSREDVFCNDHEEVPGIDAFGGEDDDCYLGEDGCYEAADETPAPETHGGVCC